MYFSPFSVLALLVLQLSAEHSTWVRDSIVMSVEIPYFVLQTDAKQINKGKVRSLTSSVP